MREAPLLREPVPSAEDIQAAKQKAASESRRIAKEQWKASQMQEQKTALPKWAPAAEQAQDRVVPTGYSVLREGSASILQKGNDVFYNPAQVVNRDLSVSVLRYYVAKRADEIATGKLKNKTRGIGSIRPPPDADKPAEGAYVLEGLAASGLRAIRYVTEVDGIGRVDANDLDPAVVEAMCRNVVFNGPEVASKVRPRQGDARLLMMQNAGLYDAVDLDPYGTPAQLLDSAVQSVSEGGLLLITATDMAVLCGNNGEACWGKYGSYPLHRPYCHEMAIRILLASIETHANRYKRHIVPILSLSIDFYIRVFVRVYTSAAAVKDSPTKLMYVWQSQGCDSFYSQRIGRKAVKGTSIKYMPGSGPAVPQQCTHCGSGFTMGGPFWAEPLHDREAITAVLADLDERKASLGAHAKLRGILTSAVEELPDCALYLDLHSVSSTLKCTPPRHEVFKSALLNAGYRVSGTHCSPLGVKTDAPWDAIWDIMRAWVIDHPVKLQDPSSYAAAILAVPPSIKVSFARAAGSFRPVHDKVSRFLPNPAANWGPKPKHGRTTNVPPQVLSTIEVEQDIVEPLDPRVADEWSD